MGACAIAPGTDCEWMAPYSYTAEWEWSHNVLPSKDPNAFAFGDRPWTLRQGLIRADKTKDAFSPKRGVYGYKPVVYLPVKRTDGKDQYPALSIVIQLLAPKDTKNLKVKIWAGTAVQVDVVNVLKGTDRAQETKQSFTGTLDSPLSCRIQIPAKTVADWLDRTKKPFQASVNENLFDFRFKLLGVSDGGSPVEGQSHTRLFLYCRKTVVFVPGLFASQVRFRTADGQTRGFPDYWDNHTPTGLYERVDVLECDDKGVPLIPCAKPSLLMLRVLRGPFSLVGWDVIEPFNSLHNARVSLLPHVPPDFRLYTLIIYPYDWRGDLTDAAAALVNHLDQLKNALTGFSKAADTDDQVAIMGHSTGGLLIRRALAVISPGDCSSSLDPAVKNASRPPADSLISFAFFLSVPFSGAPKAGAVLLTGRAEPEGDKQIKILDPESLVAVSLSMPIVYHLHTTANYDHRPATSPSRPPGVPKDNEADKSAFVKDALQAGLMPRPWLVRADLATAAADREKLAVESPKWHQLVADLHERISGHNLKYAIESSWNPVKWFQDEIQKRGLQWQKDVRQPSEWNGYLAARATAFYQKSQAAVTGVWKDRSCILWGSCDETATLRQVNLSRVSTHRYDDTMAFLQDHHVLIADIGGTTTEPRIHRRVDGKFRGGSKQIAQWALDGKQFVETTWRLEWVLQFSTGDGTVPSDSQLAESTHIKTKLLTHSGGEAPEHMDSTKSDQVWHALVSSIHGGAIVAAQPEETNALADNEKIPRTFGTGELPFFEPPPGS